MIIITNCLFFFFCFFRRQQLILVMSRIYLTFNVVLRINCCSQVQRGECLYLLVGILVTTPLHQCGLFMFYENTFSRERKNMLVLSIHMLENCLTLAF